MLRKLILVAGVAFALLTPAYATDPQTFKTEDSATAFCKTGNVVWFNPASKIYFPPGSTRPDTGPPRETDDPRS